MRGVFLHRCKFFVCSAICRRLRMEMLKEKIREITLVQINSHHRSIMRLRKPVLTTNKTGIFRPNNFI